MNEIQFHLNPVLNTSFLFSYSKINNWQSRIQISSKYLDFQNSLIGMSLDDVSVFSLNSVLLVLSISVKF